MIVKLIRPIKTQIFDRVSSLVDWAYCRQIGVRYDFSWRFFGLPFLRGRGISAGKRLVLCSANKANALGVIQPVVMKTVGRGRILIGNDVGIRGSSLFARELIQIGNRVLIGTGCLLWTLIAIR